MRKSIVIQNLHAHGEIYDNREIAGDYQQNKKTSRPSTVEDCADWEECNQPQVLDMGRTDMEILEGL
jgi:hypothetical protein